MLIFWQLVCSYYNDIQFWDFSPCQERDSEFRRQSKSADLKSHLKLYFVVLICNMFHMSLSVTPSSQLSSLKFSHSILNPLVQSGHPSLQTLEKGKGSKAQWFMSIIPALGKMKENFKFKASLGYKAGPCIKKKKTRGRVLVAHNHRCLGGWDQSTKVWNQKTPSLKYPQQNGLEMWLK
jgi:hypothetical protein